MTKTEQKVYRGSLKFYEGDDEKKIGTFRAVFGTFGAKDLDGDVTLPGAFANQDVVIEPWNHGYSLPVGVGKIGFDTNEVWVDGAFFLNTQSGKEHYEVVKSLPNTEWSYTFRIKASHFGDLEGDPVRYLTGLDVAGVGPVTRGVGVNTRTIGIKGRGDEDEDPAPESQTLEGVKEVREFIVNALIDTLNSDTEDQE